MWGYMGKVPARGDFLAAGIRPEVRDLFFEWFQGALAVSRDQLADQWMDAYLTSPIWHFCASPGGILDTGLVGTLIPSVDRVGRHFPFLVVKEFGGQALDGWRSPQWASSMEDCILAVLEDDWREDGWCQQLKSVEAPKPSQARMHWPKAEGNLVLSTASSETEWLEAILRKDSRTVIWWTQGSAFVEPVTLLTEGLPKIGQFVSMMVGQWGNHGWLEAGYVGDQV